MSSINLTGWILSGAGLAALTAAACGSADEPTSPNYFETVQVTLDHVDAVPQDYVIVPGGLLAHRDCVHQVPDDAEVDPDFTVKVKGARVAQYAPCTHKMFRWSRADERVLARTDGPGLGLQGRTVPGPSGITPAPDGWVEASWASSTQTQFTQMNSGYWTVPANPTGTGQTIFFFPSFTNATPSIVQPVLQWGNSSAGSFAAWKYTNWAVVGASGSGGVFYGTLKSATAGDLMSGTMNLNWRNATQQSWTVTTSDVTKGQTASNTFTFNDSLAFNQVQSAVLEAYSVDNCNDFPGGASGSTYFGSPQLFQGNTYTARNAINPAWSAITYNGFGWTGIYCNFGISVSSNGSTTLNY